MIAQFETPVEEAAPVDAIVDLPAIKTATILETEVGLHETDETGQVGAQIEAAPVRVKVDALPEVVIRNGRAYILVDSNTGTYREVIAYFDRRSQLAQIDNINADE